MVSKLHRGWLEEPARGCFRNTLLAAVGLLMLSGGCAPPAGISKPPSGLDLTERFVLRASAYRRAEGEKPFVRHERVVRNGLARDAMLLVAPVTIRAPLDGISGSAVLAGFSAPVYNVGDGLQMYILLLGNGSERVIYSRYYDGGRRLEDRAWIAFEIPLDLGDRPDDYQLEIRVSGGPQGDLVADWLALSAMRIVQRQAAQ
jgi:hypothetical protein